MSSVIRVCALALGVSATVVVFWQAPAPISAALRAHVQSERLDDVTAIRGLPLGVRGELEVLFGNGLDIANPGTPFQGTNAAETKLPLRGLISAGCSVDHCVVYYERAGKPRTWHAALFHWTPDTTKVEIAGTAPAGLANVDAVRTALLSGVVKGPPKIW